MNFSKTITMAVALLMATNTFAYTKDRNQNDQMDKSTKDRGHIRKSCKMASYYSAPARYDVTGSWDLFFTADFIYWQARSDGIAYGVAVEETTTNNATTAQNRVLNADFGWHPGVKVGLGYNSTHDDWELYAQWTHIVSSSNDTFTVEDNQVILPTLIFPFIDTLLGVPDIVASDAATSWKCVYNTIDLELARPYYLGKYITLRPHMGLRGYWIHQRDNNQYDGVRDAVNAAEFGTIRVNSKYNTWGIGPRFGMNGNWLLGSGFRLFGDVAGTIAWNSVNSRKNQDAPDLINAGTPNFVRAKDKKDNANLRPNCDAELGIGWGNYFSDQTWHFDLSLAYEFHYWADHNFDLYSVNDVYEGLNDSIRGNLALHGGTLRMRLDF